MTTIARSPQLRGLMDEAPRFGTFVKIAGTEVVDLIALAGFDFAVLDLEHSQLSYTETRQILAASRAHGLQITVRIPTLDTGLANRLLEAGASGIQLSTLRSAQDAAQLRSALRYGPEGTRSISLSQPSARFGAVPLTDHLANHTDSPLVVGQIETATLDDDIDSILEPLDVAFIGTLDLSVSVGTPGNHESPQARAVVDNIVAGAERTDTALGIFVSGVEEAQRAVDADFRYIVVGSDIALFRSATSDLANRLRRVTV